MASIDVKCYIFSENVKIESATKSKAKEIRRFSMESSPGGIYVRLLDNILKSFEDFETKRVRICWQDEENELVEVSADEDVDYAVDIQTETLQRKLGGQEALTGPILPIKFFVFKMF